MAVDAIFDRAITRGEADPARLTPRGRALPFDLPRSHMMMTMESPGGMVRPAGR